MGGVAATDSAKKRRSRKLLDSAGRELDFVPMEWCFESIQLTKEYIEEDWVVKGDAGWREPRQELFMANHV